MSRLAILSENGFEQKNTGSLAAQLLLLTVDLRSSIAHLKVNGKDVPHKRSMLKKLATHRRLSKRLQLVDSPLFLQLKGKLTLKNKTTS